MSGECDECGYHAINCICHGIESLIKKRRRKHRLKAGAFCLFLGLLGTYIITTQSWDEVARKGLCFALGLGLSILYDRVK